MSYKQKLIDFLGAYAKATVGLSDLEQLFRGDAIDYGLFAKWVLELESEGILEPVKVHGRNGRIYSLAYHYRIQKRLIHGEYIRELHFWGSKLHATIQLDSYYHLGPYKWREDLPYIQKIDTYLRKGTLPQSHAPAPERSYELVRDEKWLSEQGGQALLERIGVAELMKIVPVSDPLMLAVNTSIGFNSNKHLHLIVENKTTFQGLVSALPQLPFSTLTLGYGRKIIGNLDMLRLQYPIPHAEHKLFYFGDLDLEGILIWHDLQTRFPVNLAMPFYCACLGKEATEGKRNHRLNEVALQLFTEQFPANEAERINVMLREGYYIPQETLRSEELIEVGRDTIWDQYTQSLK